ncbi:MAG: class I SAM-dependent methyltransferase [Eubacteriales bacterium]
MFIAKDLTDYKVLDTGDGMKLEDWGGTLLSRPDPQVIWPKTSPNIWQKADGVYHRSDTGGGEWQFSNSNIPERWSFNYKGIKMYVKPTGFKHTGVFPEQAANWDWIREKIKDSNRNAPTVLNLFGYTGGASLAALSVGANVVHVDAARSMIEWFKENLSLSHLDKKPIRYMVDDCLKFVLREQRRGNTYDGIIMDPPSYGRGKNGEIWKMEKDIYNLVVECVKIMSPNPLFFLINSYTTGLSHVVTDNILIKTVVPKFRGRVRGDVLALPVANSKTFLPCGTASRWER